MTQDHSVTATFAPLYTLTVNITGNGSVTSTDGFINCPGVCSHVYVSNSSVTLNASPAQGWSFGGWSGACTGSGPCNLTITQNQSVTATFTQNYYTLTASISGDGTVTSTDGFINCPGTCSHSYLSNTPVTLNASPAQGWSFSGWTGACNGIGSCNLAMSQNLAVSAIFVQPGNALQFTPVAPCRLLDTRPQYGGSGPLQGGTSTEFGHLTTWRLQHSYNRRRLFAECHRRPARTAGIPDHLANRRKPAHQLNLELGWTG